MLEMSVQRIDFEIAHIVRWTRLRRPQAGLLIRVGLVDTPSPSSAELYEEGGFKAIPPLNTRFPPFCWFHWNTGVEWSLAKRAMRQSCRTVSIHSVPSKSSRKVPGGEAMLKSTIPEQNAERAKQAANYGMDWMRQFMEESLNQTRAIFDRFFSTARKTANSFDQQAAEVRERSMSMATDTLSNSMDFAQRALKVRQPQDLLQLQTEFVSRQAQVLAQNSKMLGETIARGASEMGKFTSQGLEEASRRSEAA
jgi:hypothetical protein